MQPISHITHPALPWSAAAYLSRELTKEVSTGPSGFDKGQVGFLFSKTDMKGVQAAAA
jgi:hypothetical protein